MRIIKPAAALLLGFILAVGVAFSASAHTTGLSHTIACDTGTYTYTVAIVITNSETTPGTIVAADSPVVKVGDVVPTAGRTYTLAGVTTPAASDVTITMSWPDGVTSTKSDHLLLADFPTCTAPVVPPVEQPVVVPPAIPPAPAVVPIAPKLPAKEIPTLAHTGVDAQNWGAGLGLLALGCGFIALSRRQARK